MWRSGGEKIYEDKLLFFLRGKAISFWFNSTGILKLVAQRIYSWVMYMYNPYNAVLLCKALECFF